MSGRMMTLAVACCAAGLLQAAALNEKEARLVKARLVPAPQEMTLTDGPDVMLDGALSVSFACAKDEKIWFSHSICARSAGTFR